MRLSADSLSKHSLTTAVLCACVLSLVFIWTRFYQLPTTLDFFNDIGRDYLVLYNWQKTLKPPLLGPQMSVIPFNQSALYFYLLMPVFVLSQHSVLSSTITVTLFYLVLFWLGLWLFRHRPVYLRSLLFVAFLFTIHPQFIIQHRFVWNPSFVAPCIVASLYMLLLLKEKFSYPRALAFSLSLALAVGFSFSAVPTAIVIFLSGLYFAKLHRWQTLGLMLISLILVYLPNAFFEIRHHFVLIKAIVENGMLSQGSMSIWTKLSDLGIYLTSASNKMTLELLILTGVLLAGMQGYRIYIKKVSSSQVTAIGVLSLILLGSICVQIISPVGVAKHYIFPILSVLIVLLSFLELRFQTFIVLISCLLFLTTPNIKSYLALPALPVAQMKSCAADICSQVQEPLMVSEQSSRHPYHSAWAYQYLLADAGCQIEPVEPNSRKAAAMILILDDSTYEHGKTAFNELTQLGPSTVAATYSCQPPLSAILLKRK